MLIICTADQYDSKIYIQKRDFPTPLVRSMPGIFQFEILVTFTLPSVHFIMHIKKMGTLQTQESHE